MYVTSLDRVVVVIDYGSRDHDSDEQAILAWAEVVRDTIRPQGYQQGEWVYLCVNPQDYEVNRGHYICILAHELGHALEHRLVECYGLEIPLNSEIWADILIPWLTGAAEALLNRWANSFAYSTSLKLS